MKRSFEAVDMMVAVGFCATILGGLLFVIASDGMVGHPAGDVLSSPSVFDTQLVEPALGEAIVSRTLLELSTDQETAAAAAQLNRATMQFHELESSPNGYLGPVLNWAARMESDNAARAEWVKGRAIVSFTQRGANHGWLSADQYINEYNDRMIQHADAAGSRIADDFASTWQATLGRAIVEAGQSYAQLVDHIQEGIGAAVVRVTRAQTGYEEANGAIQMQLAALTNAAIRSELQADLFDQLAQTGTTPQPTVVAGETKTWPEVSSGHIIGATMALMGLLIAGLVMASRRPSDEAVPYAVMEPAERVYRKTA
jgi:hypothetical protein